MSEFKMKIYPLFSKPLSIFTFNIDNNKILNCLKKQEYKKSSSANTSQISISNKLLENKSLKKEKIDFEKSIKKYLKNVLHYSKDFKIHNSWGTKAEKNQESQAHVHQNSWISAVYYPKENNNFSISFSDPHHSFYKLDYDNLNNIFTAKEFTVFPKTNTLLIFPSETFHKINKNKSNETRYSLSFNVVPVGIFQKGGDAEIKYT